MALAQAEQTIIGTEAVITASVSGSRLYLAIRNVGASSIYIGATGVTPDNGMPLHSGEMMSWDQANDSFAGETVYAIASSGATVKVRVLEAS